MQIIKATLLSTILALPVLTIAETASATPTAPTSSVDQWTCEEFIALDEQFKPKAIYWASAHNKHGKKAKSNILNIEATEQVIPMVIDECTQNPKATFWDKLKASWKKVKSATKSEMKEIKSDLGDIKTNLMNNP